LALEKVSNSEKIVQVTMGKNLKSKKGKTRGRAGRSRSRSFNKKHNQIDGGTVPADAAQAGVPPVSPDTVIPGEAELNAYRQKPMPPTPLTSDVSPQTDEAKEPVGEESNTEPPAAGEESQIIDTPLLAEPGPKPVEDYGIPTEPNVKASVPSEHTEHPVEESNAIGRSVEPELVPTPIEDDAILTESTVEASAFFQPTEDDVEGSHDIKKPVEQEHVPKSVDDYDIPLEITLEASAPSEPTKDAESQTLENYVKPAHVPTPAEEKAHMPSKPSTEAEEFPNARPSANPEGPMELETQVQVQAADAKPRESPEVSLPGSPVVLAPEIGLAEAHQPPPPNDSIEPAPSEETELAGLPEPVVILEEGPDVLRDESFPVKDVLLHQPMTMEASQSNEKCDCLACVIL
jgi:hypothetical protein